MKAQFSKKMILHIYQCVAIYKKLFVTTEGVMFPKEEAAEEAVRTKNMILDDPESYVGIATITEDQMTLAKLREYGKDPGSFSELFENARIPRMRPPDKTQDQSTRFEKPRPVDQDAAAAAAAALGLTEDDGAAAEKAATEKEAAEKAATEKEAAAKKAKLDKMLE